ncbi:MAG: twin-arginine translocase TatA/TatE family subunit [Nitrospirota bacterium]
MFGLGMQELIIILVIVLVLFGAKRLPELASGMGKAIRNFKKATSEPDEIDVTPAKKTVADEKEKSGEEKKV